MTEAVMDALGAKNARQLADALGWEGHDSERKASRLVSGEGDPRLSTIAPLLAAGGLLTSEAIDVIATADPRLGQKLKEARERAEAVAHARGALADALQATREAEQPQQDPISTPRRTSGGPHRKRAA